MAKKNSEQGGKGRRYSAAERSHALNMIDKHNREHMRGGLTAVSRELGISQVTLRSWLNDTSMEEFLSENASIYQQLAKYAEDIERLKAELALKEKEYKALKRKVF